MANLPFARNWWRHLQRAGVRNFALLATDDEMHATLLAELPAHAVRCPRSIVGGDGNAGGPARYRSASWTKLMFAVPRMVRWVLQIGLNVLWMDTDVVALSDPLAAVRAQRAEIHGDRGGSNSGSSGGSSGGVLLASVDGRVPAENPHECERTYTQDARWGRSAGGWKLCGGLFYLEHSAAALSFLHDWERRLRAPGAGAKNQPHYNEALRASPQMRVHVLPCDLFPNGFRYANGAWRRAQRRAPIAVHNSEFSPRQRDSKGRPRPARRNLTAPPRPEPARLTLHAVCWLVCRGPQADWIKGADAKRERFLQWRMWQGSSAVDGSPEYQDARPRYNRTKHFARIER